MKPRYAVIPAKVGIQWGCPSDIQNNQPYVLDSRLRGNDGFVQGA